MMETGHQVVYKRLRLAGILIAFGLVTEAITLVWNHPLAFMSFLGLGVLLMVVGMVLFLWTIVSEPEPSLIESSTKQAEGKG